MIRIYAVSLKFTGTFEDSTNMNAPLTNNRSLKFMGTFEDSTNLNVPLTYNQYTLHTWIDHPFYVLYPG